MSCVLSSVRCDLPEIARKEQQSIKWNDMCTTSSRGHSLQLQEMTKGENNSSSVTRMCHVWVYAQRASRCYCCTVVWNKNNIMCTLYCCIVQRFRTNCARHRSSRYFVYSSTAGSHVFLFTVFYHNSVHRSSRETDVCKPAPLCFSPAEGQPHRRFVLGRVRPAVTCAPLLCVKVHGCAKQGAAARQAGRPAANQPNQQTAAATLQLLLLRFVAVSPTHLCRVYVSTLLLLYQD